MSRTAKKVRPSKPVSDGASLEQARLKWTDGKLADCARILDRILAAHPDHAEALHLRGAVTMSEGNAPEAVEFFSRAARIAPAHDDYLCDLGTALHAQQRASEAEETYRTVLNRSPDHVAALSSLANLLREQTRLPEALQCYTRLLEGTPDHPVWNNLGFTLLEMGHKDEALNCFAQALRVNPRDVLALANVALIEQERGQLTSAVRTLEQALVIEPRNPELHLNLGNLLVTLGRTNDGLQHLRCAIEISPTHSAARSALICALDYDPSSTTADQQRARKEWYKACVRPRAVVALDHYRNPDPDRKLRIGYVSADFRFTSAAMAFFPMLHDYDRNGFEVYCYSNNLQEDAVTTAIRGKVSQFRVIAGMSDADAAAWIASDGIDILMDLSGHMKGHRLGVFAHRPAPLQGTAWGYTNGTGMKEMDFIFADPVFVTATDATHFSERLINLPSVIPYQPLDTLPPVTELPAVARGEITFGCYSRLQKITEATTDLWSKVLLAVPGSKLVLKAAQNAEAIVLEDLLGKFAARGVDGTRLRFLPHTGWREHMESFSQIDVQLDPFPHGGGVSLLDGIAMGVPSLTLRGQTPPSRLGAALLSSIGIGEEWIAECPLDFVNRAVKISGQIAALQELRTQLRTQLLMTLTGQPTDYVRGAESQYRRLWGEQRKNLQQEQDHRLRRARQNLAQGQGAAAMLILQPLLSATTTDATTLHYAGLAAFQTGDLDAAENNLLVAVKTEPDFPDLWVDLGIIYTEREKFDRAIDALRTATELQPSHFLAWSNLGITLLKMGQLDEAMNAFKIAQRLDPNHAGVLSNIGIIHERNGDWVKAEEFYRLAVKHDPKLAVGHANLGRVAIEQGRELEAVEDFERALGFDPGLHWLRYELAFWYEKLGLSGRMKHIFDIPGLGSDCRIKLLPRLTAEAFVLITRLIEQDGKCGHKGRESLASDLMVLSGRLMEINHPAKIELLKQTIVINPSHLPGYVQLGIAHHHDGHYDLAAAAWRDGLRKRDERAEAVGLADHPDRVLDSSWTLAVGHLQLFDVYVKSMQLGLRPRRTPWLLQTPKQPIPNKRYFDYWRPHINTIEPGADGSNALQTARAVGVEAASLQLVTDHFFADRIPGVHEMWHMQLAASIQRQWELERRPPLLQLSTEDREFGAAMLRSLGIPENAWYVCVHVREAGFWWKWDRYHASIRNADIGTYRTAFKEIASRGGWVIRMGDNTMRPLPSMPHVLDYAHSEYKSERMDVFLCGSARMFIGVNSGLSLLPPTFGVPCLLTNFVPIAIPFPYGADRMLPKRYRFKANGHVLSYKEMFAGGAANYYSETHLPSDLEVIDNSDEEIAEGVAEMLDGVEASLSVHEKAEVSRLRCSYDALALAQSGFIGTPIGARYLLRHKALLDDTQDYEELDIFLAKSL